MTEYARDDYRKITGVGTINRTGPDAGGSGGMYGGGRRRQGNGSFAGILATERSRNAGEISVKSTGYSPNGMPVNIMILMKDYTYQ